MIRVLSCFIAYLVLVSFSYCQSPVSSKLVWQPSGQFPTALLGNFKLDNLCVAKTGTDGKAVKILKPLFEMETSKEPVTVTKS